MNFKLSENNPGIGYANRMSYLLLFFLLLLLGRQAAAQDEKKGLKDYYKEFFPIGVAVNARSLEGNEAELLLKEFNSITAENAMKMGPIHPKKDEYNWALADRIVSFAQRHHLKIRGHTLLWHKQTPDWIFEDDEGRPIGKQELLRRLKSHIFAVVGRYKGEIYAWDVVNEAIADDPNEFLRQSKWIEIAGEEILAKAFEYAHEADPDALLFYNDYNSVHPEKRERIYRLLKKLVDAGVPIHGVGLQAHWSISGPSVLELEQAIERYASLGLHIHFTELDISVHSGERRNKREGPAEAEAFTPFVEQKQIDQYEKVFSVFRKYKKYITSVTFWNLSDRYSWLNNYPVRGRKNYPLLFDRELKRKKAYWKVIDFAEQ